MGKLRGNGYYEGYNQLSGVGSHIYRHGRYKAMYWESRETPTSLTFHSLSQE